LADVQPFRGGGDAALASGFVKSGDEQGEHGEAVDAITKYYRRRRDRFVSGDCKDIYCGT
jgi:hypothetical protein